MPVQIQDFYHLGRVLAVKDYSFSLDLLCGSHELVMVSAWQVFHMNKFQVNMY